MGGRGRRDCSNTSYLLGSTLIAVHPRCVNIAREFRLYSYKVDKVTNDVLPIIVDNFNHGIDAARYALDGFVQKRGGLTQWEKLGADYIG